MSRVCSVVLGSLMAVFISPMTAQPAGAATPGYACGVQVYKKADGSAYVCSFADDFSGTSLNTSKWVVQTSAGPSGFSPGDTCYMNSRDNVFVKNGYLSLVGRVAPAAFECKTPYRTFATAWTGGSVVSWDKFSQAYGRFSFRARYPATREAGYHGNLWMYPQRNVYGEWPHSGEIDIAENWSGHVDRVFPSLHYLGSSVSVDSAWSCKVENIGNFHTYTLEWTATQMKFFYDSALCFTRSWSPQLPLVAPQPFDRPFVLVMSQGLALDGYFPISSNLPTSGTMQIDWVRVWR